MKSCRLLLQQSVFVKVHPCSWLNPKTTRWQQQKNSNLSYFFKIKPPILESSSLLFHHNTTGVYLLGNELREPDWKTPSVTPVVGLWLQILLDQHRVFQDFCLDKPWCRGISAVWCRPGRVKLKSSKVLWLGQKLPLIQFLVFDRLLENRTTLKEVIPASDLSQLWFENQVREDENIVS